MGKIRDFIIKFKTGPNYEHGTNIKKYFVVDRLSHTPRSEWDSHYVIQFDTKKEWYSWRNNNVSKNERRFWTLYQLDESNQSEKESK